MCVCVFLASGYRWVTVMHEIPIYSAHPLMSLPYPKNWQYYSSGPPGGVAREGSNKSVVSWLQDSVAAAGGQLHNLGSFPITPSQEYKRRQTYVFPISSRVEEWDRRKLVDWAISDPSSAPCLRVRGRAGNQYLVRMGGTHKAYSRSRIARNTNYSILARNQARRHWVYSGHYPGTFVAPKNA